MNCPYCLSKLEEEAIVCKACSRDLYLLKPMMAKIAELEKRLTEIPDHFAYEERITELESVIEEHENKRLYRRGAKENILDVLIFLLLPLMLLLAAHNIITVVYDTKIVYLRIISMALPLPFGYFLFNGVKRSLLLWFLGAIFLAISAVLGMSWITSLIDKSPVLPQNAFELQEFLEYAASIAFSFLTGMLIGKIVYNQKHLRRSSSIGPKMKFVLGIVGEGKLSPEKIHNLVNKANEYGGSVVAVGTTALSIYTGLKNIL